MNDYECPCPTKENHPVKKTDSEVEYSTCPGMKTPSSVGGFMKLSLGSYIDHTGVEHKEITPEGYLKTENIAWRAKKPYLEEMISELKDGVRYNVFIYEESN